MKKRCQKQIAAISVCAILAFGIGWYFASFGPNDRNLSPKNEIQSAEETAGLQESMTQTAEYKAASVDQALATTSNRAWIIQRVIDEPFRAPKPSTIPQLFFTEEARLIETCKRLSLTNRYGITVVLAFGGSDAAAEEFLYSIREEFRGRAIDRYEEERLLMMARYLGVLARRSNRAWEVLKDGCNQRFWAASDLWKGVRGQTAFYLANYCIQGVGLVGTTESAEFLNELRAVDFLKVGSDEDLRSAVISAAAYADLLREHGSERFFDDIFMRRAEYEFFVKWKTSENAESWLNWNADALNTRPMQ